MPKIITDQQSRQICKMISSWLPEHKLDWNSICLGAQEILDWDTAPTRQALNKRPSIKAAYTTKKALRRKEEERITQLPKPRSIADAAETIAKLKLEIERLNAFNSTLMEMTNTIIYNASLHSLTKRDLMKPLPTVKDSPSSPDRANASTKPEK